MGEWVQLVGFAGHVPQQQGESGHTELLRGTQCFVEGRGQAAKWARMGEIKSGSLW